MGRVARELVCADHRGGADQGARKRARSTGRAQHVLVIAGAGRRSRLPKVCQILRPDLSPGVPSCPPTNPRNPYRIRAPPARIGLATFGLGNGMERFSVSCSNPAKQHKIMVFAADSTTGGASNGRDPKRQDSTRSDPPVGNRWVPAKGAPGAVNAAWKGALERSVRVRARAGGGRRGACRAMRAPRSWLTWWGRSAAGAGERVGDVQREIEPCLYVTE